MELETVCPVLAAEPAPTPVTSVAPAVLFVPSVDARGAATTIGAMFATPISPVEYTPGSMVSGLPMFRSAIPAGTAATA